MFINIKPKIQMELRGIDADHFTTYSPNIVRRLSECKKNMINIAWYKSCPCLLIKLPAAVFTSLFEE